MMFDWPAFLQNHNIDYIEERRGHVAVRCPFCSDDPSHHMSINLEGRGWRCFRQPDQHKGRSPVLLIAKLINIPIGQARRICGTNSTFIPEDFIGRVNDFLSPQEEEDQMSTPLLMPKEFRRFNQALPSRQPYINYLVKKRGFAAKDIDWLCEQFDLRYAVRGAFHHRVIFPVEYDGELVTWTGRAIAGTMSLRYLSLPSDPDASARLELPPAKASIGQHLLWYDRIKAFRRPKVIVLTEGPFDALKIWYLGQQWGVVATCFFTATASSTQIDELHELLPRFSYKYLLLDRNTLAIAMRLHSLLEGLGVEVRHLPDRIKDAGELNSIEFLRP